MTPTCANPDCEDPIDPGAASRYCSMACELADRHGLEGREIRADGGTQATLAQSHDTREPDSALERQWDELRKVTTVNHESRWHDLARYDTDTDASTDYDWSVSWVTNLCGVLEHDCQWTGQYSRVYEPSPDREIRCDGGQPSDRTYRETALERGRPTDPCECETCECELHTYPEDDCCIWCQNGDHHTQDTTTDDTENSQ